ncbi:hypothetical protein AAFF_G00035750 [Aldrovandia affinis]|uniref:Uncharacterized protein n=1 Tax=Aldrovandia affinis TaxID=143900 RepID=A0AAD7S367_9TELE|nr:hypothetical protein AAFF_G00035750 [Aldrovandia affinis]
MQNDPHPAPLCSFRTRGVHDPRCPCRVALRPIGSDGVCVFARAVVGHAAGIAGSSWRTLGWHLSRSAHSAICLVSSRAGSCPLTANGPPPPPPQGLPPGRGSLAPRALSNSHGQAFNADRR